MAVKKLIWKKHISQTINNKCFLDMYFTTVMTTTNGGKIHIIYTAGQFINRKENKTWEIFSSSGGSKQ